jgi:hypothetical protein
VAQDMPVVTTAALLEKVNILVEVDKAAADARSRLLSDQRNQTTNIQEPDSELLLAAKRIAPFLPTTPAQDAARVHPTAAANARVYAASEAMTASATAPAPQAPETNTGAVVNTTS